MSDSAPAEASGRESDRRGFDCGGVDGVFHRLAIAAVVELEHLVECVQRERILVSLAFGWARAGESDVAVRVLCLDGVRVDAAGKEVRGRRVDVGDNPMDEVGLVFVDQYDGQRLCSDGDSCP